MSHVSCLYCAELESIRVLNTTGLVEIQQASQRGWMPLTLSNDLLAGDRIRTGEKSSVNFRSDSSFSGMVRIGERSVVRFESTSRWVLEKGKLWALWEYDGDSKEPLEIRAGDQLEVRAGGGVFMDVRDPIVEIRSFGSVSVSGVDSPRSQGDIPEGFRGILEEGVAQPQERLGFADYQDWRSWMTEAYRLKDKALLTP